jgi:hypothetical protein
LNPRRCIFRMVAVALFALLLATLDAQDLSATPKVPSAPEAAVLSQILSRLHAAGNASLVPINVDQAIGSLNGEVTKTFSGTSGSRYSRVTVRLRTRHTTWDPSLVSTQGGRPREPGAVGWYMWRWQSQTTPTSRGLELTITANNLLMLDPEYTTPNEEDPLGRLANEALLYHELLHLQLVLNAMNEPAWGEALCRTGQFDITARDAEHTLIHTLERDYLALRGLGYSWLVAPGTLEPAGGKGFVLVVGDLPERHQGRVSARFRLIRDSNVKGLRVSLPQEGPYVGKVVIMGELLNTSRAGFFMADIEPAVAPAPILTAHEPGPV